MEYDQTVAHPFPIGGCSLLRVLSKALRIWNLQGAMSLNTALKTKAREVHSICLGSPFKYYNEPSRDVEHEIAGSYHLCRFPMEIDGEIEWNTTTQRLRRHTKLTIVRFRKSLQDTQGLFCDHNLFNICGTQLEPMFHFLCELRDPAFVGISVHS